MSRSRPVEEEQPVALSIHWRGEPHYRRLRALGEAIALALTPAADPAPRASPRLWS